MNVDEESLKPITSRIIGCTFQVGNTLGCGFLEKVYERALAHELKNAGLKVESQRPVEVWYDGVRVGEYVADLLVEDAIIVELKASKAIDEIHVAQCLNYLKATDLKICLLLNFGTPKVQVKRIVNNL